MFTNPDKAAMIRFRRTATRRCSAIAFAEVRMPIAIEELDGGVTKVVLSGRLDIAGAQEIDMRMNIVGGSRKAVVIDLSAVDFLASIGLRTLVHCAKAVQNKGGRAVLLSPIAAVAEVIRFSGIDELIPVLSDDAEAIAAVRPA